jgi:ADP-ribose pyrophosphatase YjhB (NUDIX family)
LSGAAVSEPTESLRAAADTVVEGVPDPSAGLPEDVFRMVSALTPLVTVDLLIKDEQGNTLLTWRDDERFGRGWHVPGGILRYKEMLAERVHACARAELGCDVDAENRALTMIEAITAHRTRGHHLSFLYRCRLAGALDDRRRAGDPPQPGQWRWHRGAPPDLLPAQAEYAQFL